MKKIQPLRYTAQPGEQILIAVKAVGTGVFVAASLDGQTLAAIPGSVGAPQYKFPINRPVGRSHFVEMEFSFPQAVASARYDVSISGSKGGSDSFSVSKDDSVKDPFMRFKVVA